MKSIAFYNISCRAGRIESRFRETNSDVVKEDSFYIEFDRFIPSEDTIALVFGSFCGQAYEEIDLDLAICQDTLENLEKWTRAKVHVREKREEIYQGSSRSVMVKLKQFFKRGDPIGKKVILNYSGGMDSLALLCCLPPNINLCSIYFEGFEREFNYFMKFRPHCVSTDVRKKIPIDKNDWEFMGFASILYKEYWDAKYLVFGTIAEAWVYHLKKHDTISSFNPLFSSAGMSMPHCTHALTELGTALVVGYYMPDELADSLRSLASVGTEKLYRKECLVNIACGMLGLDPVVKEYHYPKQKMKFGRVFATDFLSFCIAKFLGIQYAAELYTELPRGFESFVNEHTMSFFSKIKQDNLTKEPEKLMSFFCKKLENSGLKYYTQEDYRELEETLKFIEKNADL